MDEFIQTAGPLAGVVIGAALSSLLGRSRDHEQWLRDKRTETYSTLLRTARELQDTLSNANDFHAANPYKPGPLTGYDANRILRPFFTDSATAELFCEEPLRVAMADLVVAVYNLGDGEPGTLDLKPVDDAVNGLGKAMRDELDAQRPWRPRWPGRRGG